MKNLNKKHYYLIGAWFIINLLQSIFTGLHIDESYYWLYSQNLDWGYFDHPPMAAFFIHLGYMLLQGELGVRIFMVLLSTLTLALILNELNEQKDYFFMTVFVLSFPLIHTHIAGFMAIPDVPLLFFTIMFLVLYRKFLQQPRTWIAVLLAVAILGMIYSKYHAFLIIGLTVLSNLKLFRNKYFWLTVALTIVLLFPHLWWQIENEFPTFKYHLLQRTKPFSLKYVFHNLISQMAMAGPFTGVLVLWKLAKFKIKNDFDRALIFNILGFYIIFFLLSFKNRIEAHWSAAIIPMLILVTYPLILKDPKIKRWFKQLAVPVIVLLLLFRIYLALDIVPNLGKIKIAFYNREEHAMEIKEMAQGKKVGFFNNWAATSNYIFYTGDSALHLATPSYRFCQYDLWNQEKFAEGKTVFAVQPVNMNPPNLTRMTNGQMNGFIEIEKFQSLKNLIISLAEIKINNNNVELSIVLTNTNNHSIFTEHASNPVLGILQDQTEIFSLPLICSSEKKEIKPGEKATLQITVHKINPDLPITIYTRSKEDVRGEIISFQP